MGVMDGKVVLVTGAARGIGKAIAIEMARAGAAVVVNDLGVSLKGDDTSDTQAAEDVVTEIEAMGSRAVANFGSVASWDDAHGMVQTALDTFGQIDGVVNNAGNLRDVLFHKMTEEEFDAVVGVHLKGSFNVSRAAAPHFKMQGSGTYVHMCSTSGLIGNLGQVNYGAAKLGIVAMSKLIAIDMQRFGVRSNAVAPFAWTRMVSSIPADTPEQQKRVDGLKKLVPEKVASLCVALSAPDTEVTGQVFGSRNNEIYLFSQPRPLRTAHTAEGWTPESIIDRVFPQFQNDFYPLHKSGDVFTWDPV